MACYGDSFTFFFFTDINKENVVNAESKQSARRYGLVCDSSPRYVIICSSCPYR
jgi:hypothetical protein